MKRAGTRPGRTLWSARVIASDDEELMKIKEVWTAVTYRYSSGLYDWRRDSRFRITMAVYEDGSVEVPARPPMSVNDRQFRTVDEAKKWAKELHRVKEDEWLRCRTPRFLSAEPTEAPRGGPVR